MIIDVLIFFKNIINILISLKVNAIIIFLGTSSENFFVVKILLRQPDYKETEQIRAYDFIDLMGNIGGYIGMFLGYALLNMADTLIRITKRIKQKDEVIP